VPADEPKRRRKKSGTESRSRLRQVNIRFDEGEFAEIDEAATQAGLTIPSWGRSRMLSAPPARAVRRPAIEKELLARILGQLGKIGSNLNQLTRAAHTTGAPADEIDEAAAEVRQAARAVMRAQGRME
jgi:hypothetical protein